MKKFIFLLLLLPFSSFAQNNEIGLGTGFAFGEERYRFYSFQGSLGGKRWQLGVGADMADDPGYLAFVTPHVFGNVKFPVKYGYFYLGAHIGYAINWEGMAWGGQAGVTANVGKRIALSSEIKLRMMGDLYHLDPVDPIVGDVEGLAAFTFGVRYRFH